MARQTILRLIMLVTVITLVAPLLPTGDQAAARSRSGGRSFSRSYGGSRTYRTPYRPTTPYRSRRDSGAFTRGLAGGFLGGALGSMLFGGGMGYGMGGGMFGTGIGLFQILLFGGIAYFIYTRFLRRRDPDDDPYVSRPPPFAGGYDDAPDEPLGPVDDSLEGGLALIRANDPTFDPARFTEMASDIFFKVQAGWMRRDIDSYRHLLGDQLAREYEQAFAEMKAKGEINKLESIAIRKVEIVDAGIDGNEEFVTVLFTANLLDYTVDDKSGELIRGSMTEPVKFAEKWTWARPAGTSGWKLEGIEVVKG